MKTFMKFWNIDETTMAILIIFILALVSTSCKKENETYTRNYSYPMALSTPTGLQASANVLVDKDMSDEDIIAKIRTFNYNGKDFSNLQQVPFIFLSTTYYNGENVEHPNPDYMLFPHSLNTATNRWGGTYYDIYGEIGEQAFVDEYLNGRRTMGMKLEQSNNYKP